MVCVGTSISICRSLSCTYFDARVTTNAGDGSLQQITEFCFINLDGRSHIFFLHNSFLFFYVMTFPISPPEGGVGGGVSYLITTLSLSSSSFPFGRAQASLALLSLNHDLVTIDDIESAAGVSHLTALEIIEATISYL